jgi:hypothetical protein
MMLWFKKLLYRWAMTGGNALSENTPRRPDFAEVISGKSNQQVNGDAYIQVALRKAVNGTILEVGTFKPNPRGPDWTYAHYVMMEGDDLSHAVAALLVKQRLEQ